jgi:hypothetical protein
MSVIVAHTADAVALFERGTIAQLSGQRHAGVVEEEIERTNLVRSVGPAPDL